MWPASDMQGQRVGEPAADRFGDEDEAGHDQRADEASAIAVAAFGVIVVIVMTFCAPTTDQA